MCDCHYLFADKEKEKVPTWTSCRYVLSYIGMAAFAFQYVLRFNLSVAIVCMVKPPSQTNDQSWNMSFENNNTSTTNDQMEEDPCGSLESSRKGYSEMVTININSTMTEQWNKITLPY